MSRINESLYCFFEVVLISIISLIDPILNDSEFFD